MKKTEHGISESKAVENMYLMRLMALLQEQVRKRGNKGAARVLEIDPKTVAESIRTGQLSRRTRDALEWALQEGIGSAAERQRKRNEKLEARLDKLETQLKELREDHRTGLKRLRMSLDGVRKYYGIQRRLIERRLSVLEADREETETRASTYDESRTPRWRNITASVLHLRPFKGPTLAEPPAPEERPSIAVERDTWAVPVYGDQGSQVSTEPDMTMRTQRSKRKRARSKKDEG